MRTLIQRVQQAAVTVERCQPIASIGAGLLLFVGVEKGDGEVDADLTARKVLALRMFPGATPMDRTVLDVGGELLVVSQFTLAGRLWKGNRPSFDHAEQPERARLIYERVAQQLAAAGPRVVTGRFGADMQVALVNDGPVTFVVEVRAGALVKG